MNIKDLGGLSCSLLGSFVRFRTSESFVQNGCFQSSSVTLQHGSAIHHPWTFCGSGHLLR